MIDDVKKALQNLKIVDRGAGPLRLSSTYSAASTSNNPLWFIQRHGIRSLTDTRTHLEGYYDHRYDSQVPVQGQDPPLSEKELEDRRLNMFRRFINIDREEVQTIDPEDLKRAIQQFDKGEAGNALNALKQVYPSTRHILATIARTSGTRAHLEIIQLDAENHLLAID